jgi:signal transduction histidine kinase
MRHDPPVGRLLTRALVAVAAALAAALIARRMTGLIARSAAGAVDPLGTDPAQPEQLLDARQRELDSAKTNFMSTVSHELRTPLTSIAGYVELLLDAEAGELGPSQQRMLEAVARNTRRLRELVEDMLILSKIESGAFRTAKVPVDVAALVRNALAAIAPAAAKASVGLHIEVHGPLPLTVDPEQIDRLLMNLLANAVKFTPPDGTVTVTARREDDVVLIVVADTGMGIPQAEQQALFVRFFRASNAIHRAIPGAGLGLAIVRTIVDNHGARVEVESTEKAGTTVTVRLPVDRCHPGGASSGFEHDRAGDM